ncbi:MAG: DUF3179 domain-containing protein [Deltaproteobacteria bacterium]|nr:DUF3179 domain-containing protein [Deltaproteobacteria bacterium]
MGTRDFKQQHRERTGSCKFSREIDGQTLTIVPSGWTYDSTFVLYDRETGTLWYPYKNGLLAIQGKYFKRILPEVPHEVTRWKK